MSPTTITGMTTAGSYTFQWTIANAPCTATSDQMVVTANPAPTTANAGPDQTICVSNPSATMAGNTAAIGAGTWTQVSGPSTATIVTPSSPTTVINALNIAGTYVFQWSIANAPCTASSDQISVIVKGIPTTANAGVDQTICASAGAEALTAIRARAGRSAAYGYRRRRRWSAVRLTGHRSAPWARRSARCAPPRTPSARPSGRCRRSSNRRTNL